MLWHCWLGGRKGIRPVKKYGGDGGVGHWLVRMEWHPAGWSVCLPLYLPLHHKVQKFSSGTGSPGWSWKKVVKRWWCGDYMVLRAYVLLTVVAMCALGSVVFFFSVLLSVFRSKHEEYPYRSVVILAFTEVDHWFAWFYKVIYLQLQRKDFLQLLDMFMCTFGLLLHQLLWIRFFSLSSFVLCSWCHSVCLKKLCQLWHALTST